MLSLGDLLQTLDEPSVNPQVQSAFGFAVAADGNLTVVGTPFASLGGLEHVGRAYLFNSATGALLATLENPAPAACDQFGYSVAVSGDTVLVGAPARYEVYLPTILDLGPGSAYVFDAATGSLLRTLSNPTPAHRDEFGYSVAVSGSTVLVGAPNDSTGATHAGSAYTFDAASGALLETLNKPAPAANDLFGWSVGVSASTIVVGACADDTGATDAGSAYLFDTATGDLLWTLNNPTPETTDHFAYSVAVSGTTVVVGAPYDNTGGQWAGSAYVFDAATGTLLQTRNNPAPAAGDHFGWSVAVRGSTVVAGAPWDPAGATDAGSVYVFDAATGNLLWTVNNPTPAASYHFGGCVALSGSAVVVGAPSYQGGAIYHPLIGAGFAYVFDAATGNLLWTLNNPTPADGDEFGYCLAVSGNTVVVGAPYDDTVAADAGSVFIFDAATGNLLHTLSDPARGESDEFGSSVAVSGNTVVVGAPYQRIGHNADDSVYIYDATTGNLLWTLAPPLARYGFFGLSVAVSGTTVVVGAPHDNTDGESAGSAYTYDAATGSLLWTFRDPTPAAGESFGRSVAVSGTTIVVGAPGESPGARGAGAAYIFDAATGNLLRTLNNPAPEADDGFGDSVAASGSTLVVAAYRDDDAARDAGSVYVYDAATGTLRRTLNNPTPAQGDQFGRSVAVSGSTVVVGAPWDATGATGAGSAYVFDAATGNLLATLIDPAPEPGELCGFSVALAGGRAAVGTPYKDGINVDRGAAYLFDVTPNPTTFDGTPGDDLFAFSTDGTYNHVSMTLAGQPTQNYTYLASDPVTFTFNGNGGNDRITIDGGPQSETVVTHPNSVTFSGPTGTYQVVATGMSGIQVTAGAGTGQTATMYDSPGADAFTASPGSASMVGPGYSTVAYGFSKQFGYASFVYGQPRQGDRANLYDGPGNDTWIGYGQLNYSEISGPGLYTRAQGFDLQYGYVTGGGTANAARFYDTPGDDVFNAKGDYSYLTGVNTQTWWFASGFQRVYAQKTAGGGYDRAYFTHSTGDYKAVFNVRSYQGYMADTAGTFFNLASDFNEYWGVASIPGNTDEAYFRTTGGGDTLTFQPVTGTSFAVADLLGTTPPPASKPVHLYAYGFRTNTVLRDVTDTAFNQATLTGTAGNDTFVGRPNDSTFTLSTGPSMRLTYWPGGTPRGFDKITASGAGGDDTATLSGAPSGTDTFWGNLADAVLSDGTLDLSTGELTAPRSPFGYYYKLSGFDTLADHASATGPDSAENRKHVIDPIDYTLTFGGTWLEG